MLYPVDPPTFYSRAGVLNAGEAVVSVSTDPCGEILAAVSATRLHLWSAGPQVSHLLARDLPAVNNADEEDGGQFVLWGPTASPTTVVVATTRRLLFFTASVVLNTQRLLRREQTRDEEPYLFYMDHAPDVSFDRQVPVDSGLIAGLAPAGPQAFLVWTTSGTLYVVGWSSQRLLHKWNTADLNLARHTLCAAPLSSSSSSPPPPKATGPRSADTRPDATTAGSTTSELRRTSTDSLAALSATSALPRHGPGMVVRRHTSPSAVPSPGPTDAAPEAASAEATTSSDADTRTERRRDALVSGVMVDAAFSVSLRLLTLVFSSGQVVIAAPSCGARFEETPPANLHLSGSVLDAPAGATTRHVRLNGRHLLAAVTTLDGRVACYGLVPGAQPQLSAAPLWKGLWCVDADRALCGAVAQVDWDPTEEMLCVAYAQFKTLVLEFSGVCTLNTAVPALLRAAGGVDGDDADEGTLAAGAPTRSQGGCTAFTWQSSGPNLFVVPTGARDDDGAAAAIGLYPLSRVIAPAEMGGPSPRSSLPATMLLGSHGLVFPTAESSERSQVPNALMGDNYPLCYGAITTDGSFAACAGKGGGVLVLSRHARRWSAWQRPEVKDHFRCVADPVWLLDRILIVPARSHATRAHALLAYAGVLPSATPAEPLLTVPTPDGQQLAAVTASARPTSAGGFVVAHTRQQHVYVYRYQVFADDAAHATQLDVTLELIRHIELSDALRWPLRVQPVASAARAPSSPSAGRALGKKMSAPHLLFHCRHTHTLVWCHSQTKTPVGFEPRSAGARPGEPAVPAVVKEDNLWTATPFRTRAGALAVVRGFWFDCSTPLDGLTLLTAESEGVFLYHLASMKVGSPPQARRSLVALTTELDSIAVGPAPSMARVLCLPAGSPQVQSYLLHRARPDRHAAPSLALVGESCCRLVPYGHRVLSTLLAATLPSPDAGDAGRVVADGTTGAAPRSAQNLAFPWEARLFYWLEKLRRSAQFVPTMDYFLRSVVEEHPSAGLRGVSRRAALRATIGLLRHFPEFYTVTIGCLRKLDMSRWHLLLDFIGSPDDLYVECVATGQRLVATHVVRIMLMNSFRPHEPTPQLASAAGAEVAETTTTAPSISRTSSTVSAEDSSVVTDDVDQDKDGVHHAKVDLHELETPKGMETSVRRATQLFELTVRAGEYTQAYELLRFLALLRHDVSLPVIEAAEDDGVFREQEFFKRVLRDKKRKAAVEPAPLQLDSAPSFAFDPEEASSAVTTAAGRAADSRLDAEEERQRRNGLRCLFERHKLVVRAIDEEATRLLCAGRLRHLVQLLSTFSLSVSYFVRQKLGPRGDIGTGPAALTAILTALHEEFGLPFAPRALPPLDTVTSDRVESACASEFVVGLLEEADLMTMMSLWSLPQFVIFSSPRILLALLALSNLFVGHTVYELALATLLMSQADAVSLVVPRIRSAAHVATEDVRWVSTLAALPRTAPLWGYLTFVESVIHSIPPNLLRNNITP